MAAYCDSNFFVRWGAEMTGTAEAVRLIESYQADARGLIAVTWLHRLEVTNAFQQMVFAARQGMGINLTPEQAVLALARFDEAVTAGVHFRETAMAPGTLVHQAGELSRRHTARHGFRAYDVAHVASALLLGCDAFWSFDAKANQLAKLEGLDTL